MNILEIKYNATQARLESLKKALQLQKKYKNTDLADAMNDSVIIRYGWAFNATISFCETYLLEHEFHTIENGGIQRILIEACPSDMLQTDHDKLLMCANDRNIPSQSYDENKRCSLLDRISEHYSIMKALVDRIQIKIEKDNRL